MHSLSPHYRNDRDSGLSEKLRSYLDENYMAKRKNLHRANPKILVVFSGGNAVGKSTLAKLIEERCGGLVLENDAIKRCILAYMPNIERDELNKLTWQYSMYLYKHLKSFSDNGLIVRDGIIDWYYDRILPIFEAQQYPIFIIGFDLSYEKSVALIKQRGDTPTVNEERLYALLQDHAVHTKRFRNMYACDVMLTDDTVFDHSLVIKKLQQRIEQLST